MQHKNFEELTQSKEFQKLLKKFEASVKRDIRVLTTLGVDQEAIKKLMEEEVEKTFKEFQEKDKKD
jgi:ADP-dependent phosphofructokinase/glucokinase